MKGTLEFFFTLDDWKNVQTENFTYNLLRIGTDTE